MSSKLSRRQFIALAGTGALGAGLAACSSRDTIPTPTPTPTLLTVEELDASIERAVRYFVTNLENQAKAFPRRLTPSLLGDTRVFELTTQEILWEIKLNERIVMFAFDIVMPTPEIRVTEGDKVRVIVQNNLKESTAIHWHGMFTPNVMDGATYISHPPIKPGQRLVYEFVAKPVGTHLYRSHHNATEQIALGLAGSLIVEPKDKKSEPTSDSDYTMLLNDTSKGTSLNGRIFPMTTPIIAKPGERVRVRWLNAGYRAHTLHWHGLTMQVIAQNGWQLPNPYTTDTLDLAPGARVDVIVQTQETGMWVVDCSPHQVQRGEPTMLTALVIR